jgi:hypothetical protein
MIQCKSHGFYQPTTYNKIRHKEHLPTWQPTLQTLKRLRQHLCRDSSVPLIIGEEGKRGFIPSLTFLNGSRISTDLDTFEGFMLRQRSE